MSVVKLAKAPSLMPLADVADQQGVDLAGELDWVGMSAIELPILWKDAAQTLWHVPARADAFVSLNDPNAKGIHMSRLFLHLQQILGEAALTPQLISRVLKEFLQSHQGISKASYVAVRFDYMVKRPALKSEHSGWRGYPVEIKGINRDGRIALEVRLTVTYSSTCPSSAALARQLIQEQFRSDFGSEACLSFESVWNWLGSEKGIVATPHSQRSEAEVQIAFDPAASEFPLLTLIDDVERALKTPVQAAVKRADEQEFARLNGQNLMFCEDASRKIQHALNQNPAILDFYVKTSHLESLHPHNAVSVVTKGVPDGFVSDHI